MSDIFTGMSGMIANQNKLDTIGNDIANAKTTGYKQDTDTMEVMQESFMRIMENDQNERIGAYENQVHTDDKQTHFDQGTLKATNKNLDVAINDKQTGEDNNTFSFFEVENNGERLLTRDGGFQLDEKGNLNTGNGSYVLGKNGDPINLDDYDNFSIQKDGRIVTADGETINHIQMRSIDGENTGYLEKVGQNNYRVRDADDLREHFGSLQTILDNFENDTTLQRSLKNPDIIRNAMETGNVNIFNNDVTGELEQGMLETSNVSVDQEMTNLLGAQQNFSMSSKAFQKMDNISEIEANQIGRQ